MTTAKPKDFRTERVTLRLSPEERRSLEERARDCGRPISTYLREVGLGSVPRARPNVKTRETIYHLSRIGNNLNQLTRVANAKNRLTQARRLEHVLAQLSQALTKLLDG